MSTRCPFLKEMAVRFCEVSEHRKLVPSSSISESDQRCSSDAYVDCKLAAERLAGSAPVLSSCPFLHSASVQYCSAASETRLIPASEGTSSRCNTSAHLYCDLFMQLSHGGASGTHPGACFAPSETELPAPAHLAYSGNHMWLDAGPDGGMHIGVDAFFARAFGRIEALRFVSGKGLRKPAVVLTVNSIDLPIVFPKKIDITAVNRSLESDPSPLVEDPYGAGWLFEHLPHGSGDVPAPATIFGLIEGEKAARWMSEEVQRMTEFLGDLAQDPQQVAVEGILAADGGIFCPAVATHVSCPDLITMFNLFFSPHDRWRS